MADLVRIFREVFRKTVDSQLAKYEEEIVEGFRREVEVNKELWGVYEEMSEEQVREIFTAFMGFIIKEVYPRTALARLEERIGKVEEKVEKSKKEVIEEMVEFAGAVGDLAGIIHKEINKEIEESRKTVLDKIEEEARDIKWRIYEESRRTSSSPSFNEGPSRLEILESAAETLDLLRGDSL